MGIGLTGEHQALAASVRAFTTRHVTREVVRAAVEREPEARPAYWQALAGQGLLGPHIPERNGGQGFSLVELAVVVEEMGRAAAPGPYVASVLASAVLVTAGAGEALLPALADGGAIGAVALAGGLTGRRDGGSLVVSGTTEPVLGGRHADIFVAPVATGADETWVALRRDELDAVAPLESLDLLRGVAAVALTDVEIPVDRILTGLTREHVLGVAAVVLGAEACGVAGWAVDTAAAYARTREQFGRPIGQFQGIKHKCARMLIELERAHAAVWDAAHAVGQGGSQAAYATGVAGALVPDVAVAVTQDCIQVHGGIGYTFEHDAHLYYRRALTLRALLGRGGHARVAGLALAGVARSHELDLPGEAEPLRQEIHEQVTALAALNDKDRVAALADGGWVQPHLPRPWGRAASPLEQVVIHQELRAAGVRPPALLIGAWVVPSLAAYGTPEQQERFLPATLRGEIVWCQLFSEPGAGSDLAGLRTRAERVEGGWRISGQKIWTSLAQHAQWGICVARTDPAAPKHKGITYFLVDMTTPGIEVRPLKELTGDEIFNEVFLDEVFVPDAMVVGEVNAGWQVARRTLTAERVNLSTGWQLGAELPGLVNLVRDLGLDDDPVVRDGLGRLAAGAHVFALLGVRATLKQLSGVDAGATANVGKLVGMEHGQRVTEYGFGLLGAEGALTGGHADGPRRHWTRLLLASRAMTIGGGTTEVNLNVIAERLLGLPRDP
ncbi:acyl-CoA dehydrogenase family protein [Actinoallomurus bryophytorum]|uniref:Alkylation response protein AidB-like acyl-CoA dehydrogenase n=1 Tax=Actinoallomurus bryophytorum TaxID=1490222 RepID=A0A543CN18_9ACTN|nr:acyl-CoA dehydrogenase [Actinoallomurus bryophytorum]TQL98489.1 alkylation response protein AidB-like acyl-CoA dehydrogenase [Actinoallomurus bryophytorum]